MSEEKLLPCPFCGFGEIVNMTRQEHPAEGEVTCPDDPWTHEFYCGQCYASTGPYETIGEARQAWNRRAPDLAAYERGREEGRRAGLEEAIRVLWGRVEREEYGHAKAAVTLDIEAVRALFSSPEVEQARCPACPDHPEHCGSPCSFASNCRCNTTKCREGKPLWQCSADPCFNDDPDAAPRKDASQDVVPTAVADGKEER